MNGGEPPSTSTAEDALNPVVAVGEPGIPRRDCEPLSYKECRVYYTDHNGIPQCPMSHQLCSTAGRWLPCGEYYFDANMVITKK
jgi:hypothetical protein